MRVDEDGVKWDKCRDCEFVYNIRMSTSHGHFHNNCRLTTSRGIDTDTEMKYGCPYRQPAIDKYELVRKYMKVRVMHPMEA